MEDAWINSAIFTAIYLKNSENAKIAEPGNLTPDELGLVMEFLIKHKKDGQFRTFWNGWEQGVQLVANQEVWVMTGWEPIVYAARKRGINAYYAVPKEGYEGWGNNTILLKGAVDRGLSETAHNFANALLAGYYGCKLGAMRGYVVPTDNNVAYADGASGRFRPEESQGARRACEGQVRRQGLLAEHAARQFPALRRMVAEAPQRMSRRSTSRRPAPPAGLPALAAGADRAHRRRPDPARPHRVLELLELRSGDLLDQAGFHARFIPRALRYRPLAGLRPHHRACGACRGVLHDPRLSRLRHHRPDERAAARDDRSSCSSPFRSSLAR